MQAKIAYLDIVEQSSAFLLSLSLKQIQLRKLNINNKKSKTFVPESPDHREHNVLDQVEHNVAESVKEQFAFKLKNTIPQCFLCIFIL